MEWSSPRWHAWSQQTRDHEGEWSHYPLSCTSGSSGGNARILRYIAAILMTTLPIIMRTPLRPVPCPSPSFVIGRPSPILSDTRFVNTKLSKSKKLGGNLTSHPLFLWILMFLLEISQAFTDEGRVPSPALRCHAHEKLPPKRKLQHCTAKKRMYILIRTDDVFSIF